MREAQACVYSELCLHEGEVLSGGLTSNPEPIKNDSPR